MTRAEEAALKAYSNDIYSGGKSLRRAYKEGYEQAEKDTIKRACLWLKTHLCRMESVEEIDLFNELFKNAMEEKQ